MKDVLLFLSAFIPMYVLILLKEVIELVNQNIEFNALAGLVLVFLCSLIALGCLGLFLEIGHSSKQSIEIVIDKAQNITDRHFLGYFSLFVLFAITFDLSRTCMFVVFIAILAMIGVVYVKNKLFYINPFLNILGYNFYKIEYHKKGGKQSENTKIFFRGVVKIGQSYFVKVKDENFSFVDRDRHN